MSDSNDKKDLQEFAEQQHKEIVRLLSVNKKLEEEIEHLKKIVSSNESFLIKKPQVLSNEELICIEQINILKVASTQGPLTLEECKKFAEYVKTLRTIRGKEDKEVAALKEYTTEELMKMVDNGQS